MKKFTLPFAAFAMVVALGFTSAGNVMAAKNYEMVNPPQPTTSKDKIEVVELFWYGCPHCFTLEPYVERWLKRKPENVKFVRMPGVFRPSWEIHGRAYYTAEVLGVVDKVHKPMFEAIHEQKRSLSDEASIMALFKANGVSEKDFKRVFRSFAVETKLRRAKDMGQRYGVRGVPALIINGKYRTGVTESGGNSKVFKVVNELVEMESK
ncbi:MAG: thiol:disulfide interchange protein DsbA/DsbL [Gammaproteobacteria bacterium]|nr:thiol:disulfide interchange protein DsbA/DsbL [Gammaproteobacteria bacterium]MCF6261324.1 thiol:disulfide interchange protein DsbA/DsbL [Gammaproteobacteria bacterium]